MFHRVAFDARHLIGGECGVQTVDRALEDYVAAVVCDGIVPPEQRGTFDTGIDEVECLGCEIAAYHGSGPEYFSIRREIASIDGKWTFGTGFGPELGVVGGAYHHFGHVAFGMYKVAGEVVDQRGLPGGIRAYSFDIVKEEGERPHSQVVHHVKLADQRVIVGLVPPDVFARMYRPDEVNSVAARDFDEFGYFAGLLCRVGLAPVRRGVIRVVLGAVDVVHLVTAVEVDERQAHLMAPRSAVEALDHTAVGHIGPVGHGHCHQRSVVLLQQLAQGLETVECAAFVKTGDFHPFVGYGQTVCTGHWLYACLQRLFLAEVDSERTCFFPFGYVEEVQISGKCLFLVFDFEAVAGMNGGFCVHVHGMRSGVDSRNSFSVDLVARNFVEFLDFGALRRKVEFLCGNRDGA